MSVSGSGSENGNGGGAASRSYDKKITNNNMTINQAQPSPTDPNPNNPLYKFFVSNLKLYNTEVSASVSSVVATAVTYPLDSVKTRMQSHPHKSALDCARHTYKMEGYKGFYRGMLAPLFTITLVRTTSMTIYKNANDVFTDLIKNNFGFDVVSYVNTKGTMPNPWTVSCFFAAGATAGAAITTIACPFELTKVTAQLSTSAAENCRDPKRRALVKSYLNKGTFRTISTIFKHRGYTGLYTGFGLHLLRDSIGTGLYFATYETTKQIMASGGDLSKASPLAVVAAGGLCGLVSWSVIYPIDTAKTVYQRDGLMCFKGEKIKPVKIEVFKRDMWRGMSIAMFRSALVNAIFFSSYEALKKKIKAIDERTDIQ